MSFSIASKTMPPRRLKPLVLFMTRHFGSGFGGGELADLEVAKEFVKQGCDIHWIYYNDYKENKVSAKTLGFTVQKVTQAGIDSVVQSVKPDFLFTSGLTQESADIIDKYHIPGACLICFWNDIIVPCKNPVDLGGGEWLNYNFPSLMKDGKPDRESINKSGCKSINKHQIVVSNSEFTKNIVDECAGVNSLVCHPGYTKEAIAKNPEVPYTERKYILLTSLQALKGAGRFLELAKAFPQESFLILTTAVAEQHEATLKQKAASLPNVSFEPWTDNMAEVYQKTKCVFIGTLTAETFSRVAVEARLSGVPCLVTSNGNLPNIIGEHREDYEYHSVLRDENTIRYIDDGLFRTDCITEGPGGIVVDQWADIEHFKAALKYILDGELEAFTPVTRYSTSAIANVVSEVKKLARFRRILMLSPSGALGVYAAGANLAHLTGSSLLSFDKADTVNPADYDMFILGGTLNFPAAKKLQSLYPNKVFASWYSHFSQMGFADHELTEWLTVAKLVKTNTIGGMFVSFEHDAISSKSLVSANVNWLPCTGAGELTFPLQNITAKVKHPMAMTTVAILGPVHQRKNVITSLIGASQAKVKINASLFLLKNSPNFTNLLNSLGTKFEVFDLNDSTKLRLMLLNSDLMLYTSHSETFSYAAIEAMILGTPVIGSRFVPALNYVDIRLQKYLWVDPNSANEVAESISRLKKEPELLKELGLLSQKHAINLFNKHNTEAKRVLIEQLDRISGTPVIVQKQTPLSTVQTISVQSTLPTQQTTPFSQGRHYS